MIIKGEDLLQGKVSKVSYSFIQMSANHTYSHLKKRLADVIEAQGISDVKQEWIHMWLSNSDEKLENTFLEIASVGEKMN